MSWQPRSLRIAGLTVGAFTVLLLGACSRAKDAGSPRPDQTASVTKEVRAFTATVAADITKRGVIAWQDHFSGTPAFFMVVDDKVIFTDRDDATKQIPEIAAMTSRIELQWGEPMRIDPINGELAMVAAPYHELIVGADGKRIEENGYFTALAEKNAKGWQFRNAHWSVTPAVPEPAEKSRP